MLWDHIYSQGDARITSRIYRAVGGEAYCRLAGGVRPYGESYCSHPRPHIGPFGMPWQLEP